MVTALPQVADALLGDRYFAGYWDLAWRQARGVDLVTRLPASRRGDFAAASASVRTTT